MASRVIPMASPALTRQQLADIMLACDRDRRRAIEQGDFDKAAIASAELDELASLADAMG